MTFKSCVPYATNKFLPNSIGILGSDFLLMSLMLAGILRKREASEAGIIRLLYRQVRMFTHKDPETCGEQE